MKICDRSNVVVILKSKTLHCQTEGQCSKEEGEQINTWERREYLLISYREVSFTNNGVILLNADNTPTSPRQEMLEKMFTTSPKM